MATHKEGKTYTAAAVNRLFLPWSTLYKYSLYYYFIHMSQRSKQKRSEVSDPDEDDRAKRQKTIEQNIQQVKKLIRTFQAKVDELETTLRQDQSEDQALRKELAFYQNTVANLTVDLTGHQIDSL